MSTNKIEKSYIGYTVSDLENLSVYELREVSRLIEIEGGEISFKYTHFFKKTDLLEYITSEKIRKSEIRKAKKEEIDKALNGTAKKANISRKESLIKSLNIRLNFFDKSKNKAKFGKELKETRSRIETTKKELAVLTAASE